MKCSRSNAYVSKAAVDLLTVVSDFFVVVVDINAVTIYKIYSILFFEN